MLKNKRSLLLALRGSLYFIFTWLSLGQANSDLSQINRRNLGPATSGAIGVCHLLADKPNPNSFDPILGPLERMNPATGLSRGNNKGPSWLEHQHTFTFPYANRALCLQYILPDCIARKNLVRFATQLLEKGLINGDTDAFSILTREWNLWTRTHCYEGVGEPNYEWEWEWKKVPSSPPRPSVDNYMQPTPKFPIARFFRSLQKIWSHENVDADFKRTLIGLLVLAFGTTAVFAIIAFLTGGLSLPAIAGVEVKKYALLIASIIALCASKDIPIDGLKQLTPEGPIASLNMEMHQIDSDNTFTTHFINADETIVLSIVYNKNKDILSIKRQHNSAPWEHLNDLSDLLNPEISKSSDNNYPMAKSR